MIYELHLLIKFTRVSIDQIWTVKCKKVTFISEVDLPKASSVKN